MTQVKKDSFQRNQDFLTRAKKVTPLAAQTYSRSYRYFCPNISPHFIERAEGCRVWDVDGNIFSDFILSLGAITVGYANAEVNEAVSRQLEKGIIYSQPSPLSIELAEKLVSIIPSAEMVRFVKNGSDATSAAIRLARAFTGRDYVVVSGYHGWQDWYIASTEHSRGIPSGVRQYTRRCPYNDLASLKKIFDELQGKVAAFILEPLQGNGPEEGYLEAVRDLVHRQGALLIFDEVVSGFRYALAGAQELYGVTPDLSTFGKGMANGMPLSCVVGKAEILNQIAEGVFISTTFGDEALSFAAALKTIEILQRPGQYDYVWKLGELWKRSVSKLISYHALDAVVQVSGLAPHCGVEFQEANGLSYLDLQSVYQQRLLHEKVLSVGINNFCLAHNEQDVNDFINAIDKALKDVKKAVLAGSLNGILTTGKIDPVFKR